MISADGVRAGERKLMPCDLFDLLIEEGKLLVLLATNAPCRLHTVSLGMIDGDTLGMEARLVSSKRPTG